MISMPLPLLCDLHVCLEVSEYAIGNYAGSPRILFKNSHFLSVLRIRYCKYMSNGVPQNVHEYGVADPSQRHTSLILTETLS